MPNPQNLQQFPETIGEFRLVGPFQEHRMYRRFQLAEYAAPDGRRAIAKRWIGSRFNMNYSRFRNEMRCYAAMDSLDEEDRKYFQTQFPQMKVPKLFRIEGADHQNMLLIEKIAGLPISTLPIAEQVERYEASLAYLRELSERVFHDSALSRRALSGHILRLPLVSIRALWRRPREWRSIAIATRYCLQNMGKLIADKRLQFVHRDLRSENLIVLNGVVTLIDFDLSLLMHPFVDIIEVTLSCWENEAVRAAWLNSKTMRAILQNPNDRAIFQALAGYAALFELGMTHADLANVLSFIEYLRTLADPLMTRSAEDARQAQAKPRIIMSNYDDIHNPFYGGGGAVAIHQVAKRLVSEYEVVVLTGRYAGAKDACIDGVHYRRIGTAMFGPKLGQLLFACILPWYVMRLQFTIWIESFTPPFSTSCLQLFTKKKVIGLVHMLAASDMWRKYKLPFQFIEHLGLKTYHHFIVLTKEDEAEIRKSNRIAHIDVIGNGVEFPVLTDVAVPKEYISFIGRIEVNQKGLDLLLRAYAQVADRIPYTLALAGNGAPEELAKVHALIEDLGIGGRVRLLGRVSGYEKDALFTKSICTVLPSRHETFSLVALETLSYNVPLLAFDIPGLQWLPDYCCVKVPMFEYEQLGYQMLQLATHAEIRDRLIAQGRLFIQHFSWQEISEQYESLIADALQTI